MFLSVPAHLGYGALAALILGESAGLPLPGETALIAAGLLATKGQLSLPVVVLVAIGAAILGDNIGFWVGRRGGRRALKAERGPFRRHRQHLLDRGEVFFARHGGKAVFLARWVVGVRVVAAVVAGATGMRIPAFMVANALGAAAWASMIGLLIGWLGAVGATIALFVGWTILGLTTLGATLVAWRARRRAARRSGTAGGDAGIGGGPPADAYIDSGADTPSTPTPARTTEAVARQRSTRKA